MFATINTAGAFYLVTKALIRKGALETFEPLKSTRYADYVDIVANSTVNIGLAAGTLLMPAISGPVGLALAAKDIYLRRAQIRDSAIQTRENARVKLANLRAWNNERKMRAAGVTGVGKLREVPKDIRKVGGKLAAMKDWRDRSRAARQGAVQC